MQENNKPILVTTFLNNGRTGNMLWQIAATLGIANDLNGIAVFPRNEIFNGFKDPFKFRDGLIDIVTHNYHEPKFHYTPFDWGECVKIRDNEQVVINLNGYFQSPKYWPFRGDALNHSGGARGRLNFTDGINNKCNLILKQIRTIDGVETFQFPVVAMHFRFGDYVNNSYYADLIKDGYYERALGYILPIHPYWRPKFLIFSDDKKLATEYCEVIFANTLIDWHVINQDSDIEDLCLMSKCNYSVIANSSFSYWGAVLGNQSKAIIAPKNWFGPSANLDTSDMYLDNMILL